MIRPATGGDAAAIAAIYNLYVRETIVTFEEDVVTTGEMAERIAEVETNRLPWLVCEEEGEVLGYAYASKWKGRCAYRFSVESTVYLAPEAQGRGIGTQLYAALFALLKERGIHAVIGGIALPNPASIALHEKLGMQQIGQFREVGYKFGQWIDVGYWQATFE